MSTTGTCPCCFGEYVAKGTMVLHGYKRPGTGWINGRCPSSSRYRPYEVSVEGTVAMLGLAQSALKDNKEWLRKLQAGEVLEFTHKTEKERYWNLSKAQRRAKSQAELYDIKQVRKGDGQKRDSYSYETLYEELLKSAIGRANAQVNQLVTDVAFYQDKVSTWKLVDLAGKNKEAAQASAQAMAALCPGSNTTQHDSAHSAYHWVCKWARCNHCGARISTTSTGKMRKHPPKGP